MKDETRGEWKPLPIFHNSELGVLRIIMRDGQPWFVLKDVANIMEVKRCHRIIKNGNTYGVDYSEWDTTDATDSQSDVVINESALHQIIFRSDKPEAVKFGNWLVSEVMPSLRKIRYEEPPMKNPSVYKQKRKKIEYIPPTTPNPNYSTKDKFLDIVEKIIVLMIFFVTVLVVTRYIIEWLSK